MHGNRGRPSPGRIAEETRTRVKELMSGPYAGCNDHHLAELLALREGIILSRKSVERIRREAGLKATRQRRPPKHRQRRERMSQEGMLLQVDGSPHHWFGSGQPSCSLLVAVDDATGKVVAAVFRDHEDAQGYFLLLHQVLKTKGIPLELYHDRPFHRLRPKGRVERLNGTLQDRLVQELRLAGITDTKAGNRFLPSYIERFNARFAVTAEEPGLAYRTLQPSLDLDLDRIFSFRYQRVVALDNTVRLDGRLIQVPPGPRRRSYAAAHVWVHELLDASLGVWYQGRWLVRTTARGDVTLRARKRGKAPPPTPQRLPMEQPEPTPRSAHTPTAPHPWRRYNPDYLKPRSLTESLSR